MELCPNCKEQVLPSAATASGKVHRYNLKEVCPDGSGKIPVALGKGDAEGEQITLEDALAKAFSTEGEETETGEEEGEDGEGDDDSGDSDESGDESEDSEDAGEEEDQGSDGDDEDAEDVEEDRDKQKQKKQPKKPKSQESDNKQNMQPPPPSPPPVSDDWAIPAAKDINRLWEERVRVRGYAPTDEELAKLMLEHSRGKVDYRPLAEKPTTTAVSKESKGLVVPLAVANQTQDLVLAVFDAVRNWQKYGGASIDVGVKRQIQKFMDKLIVCQNCGTTDTDKPWCKDNYQAHQWRARHMIQGDPTETKDYEVMVRDYKHNVVRNCKDFCLTCNEPIYSDGALLHHAGDTNSLCKNDAIKSGGKPTEEIKRGTKYNYRPWAITGEKYAPADQKCPKCGELTYAHSGSAMRYHVSTGNVQCTKGV
jgi:ribosomal protein L32